MNTVVIPTNKMPYMPKREKTRTKLVVDSEELEDAILLAMMEEANNSENVSLDEVMRVLER